MKISHLNQRITERSSLTLLDLVLAHNNDYGFDPINALSRPLRAVPNVSVIIPYYETGRLVCNTLRHLYNSIAAVLAAYPKWHYEVILLDDGSQHIHANNVLNSADWQNLTILSTSLNQGRTLTRNQGLQFARYEKCVFMDSDIFIDTTLLLNNLRLHCVNLLQNRRNSITIALFENKIDPVITDYDGTLHSVDLRINDFRSQCTYQEGWIGCESDKAFISQEFHLVSETNFFRQWKGQFGPWCLTNMVLGGFFMVDRNSALAVSGFDSMFAGYGFTETSLPTKLIAKYNDFLIPQTVGGAVHHEGNPAHNDLDTRNKNFREKHDLYFNHYLRLPAEEAISRPLHGWNV